MQTYLNSNINQFIFLFIYSLTQQNLIGSLPNISHYDRNCLQLNSVLKHVVVKKGR